MHSDDIIISSIESRRLRRPQLAFHKAQYCLCFSAIPRTCLQWIEMCFPRLCYNTAEKNMQMNVCTFSEFSLVKKTKQDVCFWNISVWRVRKIWLISAHVSRLKMSREWSIFFRRASIQGSFVLTHPADCCDADTLTGLVMSYDFHFIFLDGTPGNTCMGPLENHTGSSGI